MNINLTAAQCLIIRRGLLDQAASCQEEWEKCSVSMPTSRAKKEALAFWDERRKLISGAMDAIDTALHEPSGR